MEHAITAILDENNKVKVNDWKVVNHSRKRTRSDDAISVYKTEDIPTSDRYKDLQEETTGTGENVTDYRSFFSSQCSLRRKKVNQSHVSVIQRCTKRSRTYHVKCVQHKLGPLLKCTLCYFSRSSALFKSQLLTLIRIELLNINFNVNLIMFGKREMPDSLTGDNFK